MKTALITLMALTSLTASARLTYPKAPSDDTVDEYFGHRVADPYRPLENDTASATTAWVEAENRVTRGYLDGIEGRDRIASRLTALNNYAKTGMPSKEADGKYYFFHNDGLRNQSVLYRADSPYGEATEVIDPNKLSDDGTVALTGVSMSPDGKYIAYTVSRSGSDWTEIFVLDAATLQPLTDHIEWAKFSGAEWDADGFYYSAYPRPEAGKEFSNANRFHSVYYHRLGTPQSADTRVYGNDAEPLKFHTAQVADKGRYLLITGSGQGNGNSLHIKDMTNPDTEWLTIEPSQDYDVALIGVQGDDLYLYTSIDAPRYRVVRVKASAPERAHWQTVIAEDPEHVLTAVDMADDKLLLTYDCDASNRAFVSSLDGSQRNEIKLPGYGTIAFSAKKGKPEVFYSFASFTTPAAVYAYDLNTGESTLLKSAEIAGFNPDDYVTEQVFYTSKDGTRVPMFLVYKKGLKRDGSNPVYLYGYGGFNITLRPGFSPNRLWWLENGGIYAQAGLRGGAEYGEPWHLAGTLQQKQNVFDDFIAAGEYMIEQGWTTPERLVIEGGSNGGLLVGAVTNQRPDLFAVAIPRVGVMDMMRYHLFTIGWNWAHDYGTSADSPDMAEYLLSYSPLHNISSDGTPYPAIMVTTADHDDRVVPAHSFKYAATLQQANTGDKPKLIRIDSKAGHGAGKPITKVIDEWTDIYSFIKANLKTD